MTDSSRAAELVGTVLSGRGNSERYRITSFIGPGEKGALVFQGQDSSGTPVAIRFPGIPDGLRGLDYEQAVESFLEEAERLARALASSDDLEQLFTWGVVQPGGRGRRLPFCVFEWLEGQSLEQLIVERAGNLVSITEALAILEPAARGLAAAHALGITHRNVRTRNLWLANMGGRSRMKVTQFVLASRIGPSDDAFSPAYGAPEQFKRSYGPVGPHTDVYGLALSLVELLSGRRALDGKDETELYLATSDLARRPTPRTRGVQVSDAVEAVLARALAVDPKRRWQGARELWDALVTAVPELTPAPPSVRPRPANAAEAPPPPADAAPSVRSNVPSIWAARDPASLIVAPAEDARLPDTAKLASFAPPRPAPSDRGGGRAWIVVTVVALIGTVLVASRLVRRPAHAAKSSASAPAETTAPVPSTSASETAARAAIPPRADEPAVRFQPFLKDMIRIPAGTFTMGSDKDGRGDAPAHAVTVTKAFFIDRTEVTTEMYAACIEAGACRPNRVHPLKSENGDPTESTFGCNTVKEQPRHPINCVDRSQAEKFCAYAQKRLPSEAEWEYAARGADAREYPWGNTAPTCATAVISGLNECRDRRGTSEVGGTTEGQSPFGALDMAGNVWEWVADGWEAYSKNPATDPHAPLPNPYSRGILRGGSWDYAPTSAKTTFRYPMQASIGNVSMGIRCARDAE